MKRFPIFVFLILASNAFAWHDFGHMVVTEIAYRHLKPEVRTKVDELLKTGATEKASDFVMASCWADDVKSDKDRTWHYTNRFFRSDRKPAKNKPKAENIVWAIKKMTALLKDASKPKAERADALRYLLHFVGDIHMPLHNVARETKEFPEGDRGGNDFHVVSPKDMDPKPRNLHFLWDMGAGVFGRIERPLTDEGRKEVAAIADEAMQLYPEFNHKKRVALLDPNAWSMEGFRLAISKVYKLKENTVPPASYLSMVRQTAKKQVALAGYRLAALLNSILK